MKNIYNISSAVLRLTVFIILVSGLAMTANASPFPEPGDFARGSKTWVENCGRCHNLRGAKDMRDDQWISTIFHMRVRAGLTGQEARDIITFMQASNTTTSTRVVASASVQGSASSATTTKDGKTAYSSTCVACHGADGKGALPGAPDFTKKDGVLSKSDAELLKNITNGFQSPGSSMAMPPKGGNPGLTSGDIESILKYMRDTFGS